MNYAIQILKEEIEMIKRSLNNFDEEHYPAYHKEKTIKIKGLEKAIETLKN